jgi:hypothetical protein
MRKPKKIITSTLLHEYLYYLFRKRCKCEYRLSTQKVLEILRTAYKMPRSMNYEILKEMEQMGLIQKSNHVVMLILVNKDNNKILKKLTKYNNEFPW